MSRLVVVSNRVPTFTSQASAGGLAVALSDALRERGGIWFGWSGGVRDDPRSGAVSRNFGEIKVVTVDLTATDIKNYYNGFSNRTLWPVLHGRLDLARFERDYFVSYRSVNAYFADRLAEQLMPDDRIWVHDYHLAPLAAMLRERGVRQPIGFFLHVPFPSTDVMSAMPGDYRFAEYLMDYDLVGFQSRRDQRNFEDFILRELGGARLAEGVVVLGQRRLNTEVYPIGIDVDRFRTLAESPAAMKSRAQLERMLSAGAWIVGVDRLDYSKGLPQRLLAFERFIKRWPKYQRHINLLQVASPSREAVVEYVALRERIDSISGRINNHFSELDWVPVHCLYKTFTQTRLASLYRMARIGLVTPLRDGMNLVAKEYVACQDAEDPGVLVLSRFAGAAERMSGSITVNPYDTDQTAEAMHRALSMTLEERKERWTELERGLRAYDIHRWCREFIDRLECVRDDCCVP